MEACGDSSRHHLAACCPNVGAVYVSYEVKDLNYVHDVKGAVAMHERVDRGLYRIVAVLQAVDIIERV